jgi:hypothetical protein
VISTSPISRSIPIQKGSHGTEKRDSRARLGRAALEDQRRRTHRIGGTWPAINGSSAALCIKSGTSILVRQGLNNFKFDMYHGFRSMALTGKISNMVEYIHKNRISCMHLGRKFNAWTTGD